MPPIYRPPPLAIEVPPYRNATQPGGRILTIQQVVGARFGVTVADIKSPSRVAWRVKPRQVAMYLSRILSGFSLPIIGRHFGGRDHTTVLHAIRRVEQLAEADPDFGEIVASLKAELSAAA